VGQGPIRRVLERASRHPCWVAALLTLILQLPLHSGWLLSPSSAVLDNPFAGTHAWAVEVVGESLWRGESPFWTDRAGFPRERSARYLGWAFLLPGALLHGWLPGLWVVGFAVLMGPSLGAAMATRLFIRLKTAGSTEALIAAGIFFGLAPVTLGAAVSGQIENTQSWILPLLLWIVMWAGSQGRSWFAVAAIWLLGSLTSPYLAMTAGLALPWLIWREGWRTFWAASLVAVCSMAVGGLLLSPGEFEGTTHLFKPAYGRGELPYLWSNPLPVADLDSLFGGTPEHQPRHAVMHQPYIGLILLAGALAFGRQRISWGIVTLIGLIVAMGPTLAWQGEPFRVAGAVVPLPARVFQWLELPPARGGQYYRFVLLAHLGLAGMLATARFRRLFLPLLALGAFDVGRSVAAYGIPWPTQELPRAAWSEWSEDPTPGAVVHIPMLSPHTLPCSPIRLAGQASHGRSLADLPRGHTELEETSVLGQLDRCTRRGSGCELPSLSSLQEQGFRYVVLDLPQVPERIGLMNRLNKRWGFPDGQSGELTWWVLAEGEAR
jgi:hypothetical protein